MMKTMSPQATAQLNDTDDRARTLVRDLHNPNPVIFWTDLVITAAIGWSAFAFSIVLDSYMSVLAFCIATLALYRGLCFIHELTHIRPKALPGFETAWNILFGVPLLLPSFTYVGVHQDHHKLSTYGTQRDPEYLPFATSNIMMIVFVAHSVLIPAFLVLRFVVLAPIGLAVPAVRRFFASRCSALSMNLSYERQVSTRLLSSMRLWESVTLVYGIAVMALIVTGVVEWTTAATWYAAAAAVCVINTLRTLAAHDYGSNGEPLDRTLQILDSIDTPGGVWTELWAPVGLRYHALHHYFPGVPYHNLPEAHRRLVHALPDDAPYRRTISAGLWQSLHKLYVRGRAARMSNPD